MNLGEMFLIFFVCLVEGEREIKIFSVIKVFWIEAKRKYEDGRRFFLGG